MADKKEEFDMAEVTDEIMCTDRYGRRNYRNSIGADNRRHWRDDFVVEEAHEEDVAPAGEHNGVVLDPDDFEYDGGEEGKREVDDLIRAIDAEHDINDMDRSTTPEEELIEEAVSDAEAEDARLREELGPDSLDRPTAEDEERETIASPDDEESHDHTTDEEQARQVEEDYEFDQSMRISDGADVIEGE